MTSAKSNGLTDLTEAGQQLVEDAQEQRTADYARRCAAWAIRVEQALRDDPLALARFRQAERYGNIRSGIPNSIMSDWQAMRGYLAVLMDITGETTTKRRDTRRYWLLAIVAILTAIVGGVAAWPSIKDWLCP